MHTTTHFIMADVQIYQRPGKRRFYVSPAPSANLSMSRGSSYATRPSSARSRSRASYQSRGWSVRRSGFRKLDRSDYKFVDLASATYANNTTGSVTLVATIPQGSTVNNRDGKSCQLTSVRIRGRIVADTTATTQGVACALVWDRQPNKALAALLDVYDVATTNNFPNRENSGRFRIIKEWRDVLNGNSNAPASGPVILNMNEYIKLPYECVSSYTTADTTGVIGDIITGALLFITWGSVVAGTADANTTAAFRVNFRD